MANVVIKNLVKRFGKTVAVDQLSLEVNDGEFVCLLGPSGCGKTTTLRCIAGLEDPDEGEIYINGRLVNGLLPQQRDIAMVFQSFALYPHMTVFDNMAFPLLKRRLPFNEIKSRVENVASILKIDHLLDRNPAMLSGGEKQRVALGRALVREPKALLLDEPLSNLDAKLRELMRSELKELQRRLKITIIMATPDPIEAMSMADRIAVMKDGRLQQYDTPENLYKKPKNLFVAEFISPIAPNIIPCSIERRGSEVIMKLFGKCFNLTTDTVDIPESTLLINGTLFIRPQDIILSRQFFENAIESLVINLEYFGDRVLYHLEIGNLKVRALSKEAYAKIGDKLWISFDINKIQFWF